MRCSARSVCGVSAEASYAGEHHSAACACTVESYTKGEFEAEEGEWIISHRCHIRAPVLDLPDEFFARVEYGRDIFRALRALGKDRDAGEKMNLLVDMRSSIDGGRVMRGACWMDDEPVSHGKAPLVEGGRTTLGVLCCRDDGIYLRGGDCRRREGDVIRIVHQYRRVDRAAGRMDGRFGLPEGGKACHDGARLHVSQERKA